jgi:hypothetical protein
MRDINTLKKCDRYEWTRLIWFRVGTSDYVAYEYGEESAGLK